ncbi:Maternal effect embryo arrest protein [Citrus sinensis]|nr:uncharacterized protein LOC18051653 [Citrus x clementina]XP_006492208.1 uncharacterized protein LOC102618113 [Citrus sinensis]KAH9745692.1 Maternal effect embryo arrest protein [Citrus sinensis]GAY51638.1 hypothetical protein CUMW_135720 [Citrus unshiu]
MDKEKSEATAISQKTLDELVNLLSSSNKGDICDDIIDVHLKALDDLVNVNSLFTIAVFVGLSLASRDQRSLDDRLECDPDVSVGKRLILYEVISFACFLLSSLCSKSLKVLINLKKIKRKIKLKRIQKLEGPFKNILLSGTWRLFLLVLSIVASFIGIVFVTLSMVNVIQVKVGKLSCGSVYALTSVASLCGIVLLSLLLYAPSMVFAVIATAPRH